jgi:7,8-dihydropterin-6-yl-methyl-4-(beta-D-ribofuranosyl)aminobenzene 5'-phosphate synthase
MSNKKQFKKGGYVMKKMIIVVTILLSSLLVVASGNVFAEAVGEEKGQAEQQESRMQNLTMTVIYDNNPSQQGLETDLGFSCLIQGLEHTILFDTGGNGSMLLTNMEKLGIHPQDIDVVVLSHIHQDHVGGLPHVLEANPKVTVYLLNAFSPSFKDGVKKSGASVVEIQDPLKISNHVYSTGQLGAWNKEEQSLILQTANGLIIITGCAHPGIVSIVRNAKELLNDDVLLVMGGFHLGVDRTTLEQIVAEFQQLGVRYVGPCHCSGDTARQVFEEAYQSNFVAVGVGTVITLEELL